MRYSIAEAADAFSIIEGDAPGPTLGDRVAAIYADGNGGYWRAGDLTKAFKDSFGKVPVASINDPVGLYLSQADDGTQGADLYAGDTPPAAGGWAWNAATRTATATAATGPFRIPHPNPGTGLRYVDDLTVTVASGAFEVYIGAAGPAFRVPITVSNPSYKLHLREGGAPDAGTYFNPTSAFTGTIRFNSVKRESIWARFQETNANRGTYMLDDNGRPLIYCPPGAMLTTAAEHVLSAPTYLAVAMDRAERVAATLFNYGDAGVQIIGHDSDFRLTAGSLEGAAQAFPGTRVAGCPLNSPTVLDVYLDIGTTSVRQDGGVRDVPDDPTLAAGELRSVANTWSGAEAYANSAFSVNATGDGTVGTGGGVKEYAAAIRRTAMTEPQRTTVTDWMRELEGTLGFETLPTRMVIGAGQSNGLGKGNYATSVHCPFATAFEYVDDGRARSLVDPTQHSYPSQESLTGSMWPAMGKKFYELRGEKMLFVGTAYSGEGMLNPVIADGSWLNGELLTDHMALKVARAKADCPNATVEAIAYYGGEGDASGGNIGGVPWVTADDYEAAFPLFLDKARTKLGEPNLKLILYLDGNVAQHARYALMRQGMAQAAANNADIYYVPFQDYVEGLGMSDDTIHINQAAQNLLGPLFAITLDGALG